MVHQARGELVIARQFLALLAAFWLSAAGAMDTVIYQPQTRDAPVTAEQWRSMFWSLQDNGVSTLLVQWTRYGDETFGGRGGWLDLALQEAVSTGLDLVLGLYWDPAFFSWAATSPGQAARLPDYGRRNTAQAEAWRHLLATGKVRGWYLPAELDDLHWQSGESRSILASTLAKLQADLALMDSPHLHLSAFFGGYQPPEDYAAWLGELGDRGWFVWVQDGSGTEALDATRRQGYLETLFACPGHRRQGLIIEAFRQVSRPGEPFRARPASQAEMAMTREAYGKHCPTRTALFSLRYLPLADGILAHD